MRSSTLQFAVGHNIRVSQDSCSSRRQMTHKLPLSSLQRLQPLTQAHGCQIRLRCPETASLSGTLTQQCAQHNPFCFLGLYRSQNSRFFHHEVRMYRVRFPPEPRPLGEGVRATVPGGYQRSWGSPRLLRPHRFDP
jgi:hypothetical protein